MSNDFWKGYTTASLIVIAILLWTNIAHCNDTMKDLIFREAVRQNFDGEIALAVAIVESNLNPSAIGPKGEYGLFQVRPEFTSVSKKALLDAKTNAKVGIEKLKEFQQICPLKENLTWVICYNNGLRKPRFPLLHPYYKKFIGILISL
jgi:hypothetical protein